MKSLQRKWIGKSEGAYLDFKVEVTYWSSLIMKQNVQNKSFSLIGHFLSDQIQLRSDIIAWSFSISMNVTS